MNPILNQLDDILKDAENFGLLRQSETFVQNAQKRCIVLHSIPKRFPGKRRY